LADRYCKNFGRPAKEPEMMLRIQILKYLYNLSDEQLIQDLSVNLAYKWDVRGIGIFTAPPGMGKAYALRCFAKDLNPNLYQMVYTFLSTVSVSEFYRQFCTMLGIDAGFRKTDMFKAIQDTSIMPCYYCTQVFTNKPYWYHSAAIGDYCSGIPPLTARLIVLTSG
jgi:hypothetical protein